MKPHIFFTIVGFSFSLIGMDVNKPDMPWLVSKKKERLVAFLQRDFERAGERGMAACALREDLNDCVKGNVVACQALHLFMQGLNNEQLEKLEVMQDFMRRPNPVSTRWNNVVRAGVHDISKEVLWHSPHNPCANLYKTAFVDDPIDKPPYVDGKPRQMKVLLDSPWRMYACQLYVLYAARPLIEYHNNKRLQAASNLAEIMEKYNNHQE
jgi:hypothetical protein